MGKEDRENYKQARLMKDSPEVGKHRSKKDTKRWCKGKVGREHQLEWVGKDDGFRVEIIKICVNCKKEFERDYKYTIWRKNHIDGRVERWVKEVLAKKNKTLG